MATYQASLQDLLIFGENHIEMTAPNTVSPVASVCAAVLDAILVGMELVGRGQKEPGKPGSTKFFLEPEPY